MGYTRRPLFTQDELLYYSRDEVVAPGALTLDSLGVKTTPMEENAINILRPFRDADKINQP